MRVSPVVGMAAALAAFLSPVETLRAAPPSGVMAATMPSSAQWIVHEVIPGERLVEVAQRYAVSTTSIVRWNGLDPQRPRDMTGARLRIQTQLPSQQRDKLSYVVRTGDSWTKIARRYHVDPGTLEKIWNRNIRALEPGQRLLIWLEPGVQPKEDPIEPSIEDLTVPVAKGGESFGWPNGGKLLNGVNIPENPALYTVRNVDHSFGSTHAIEVMQRGMAAFRLRTRFPGEILLWDMSVKRGGRFGPHHSHRTGRDVDIALLVKPGFAPDAPNDEAIDWQATWQLVRSFIETGEVKYIFMSRQRQAALYKAARADGATPEELEQMIQFPRFTKYGIVRHSPGHHCHLHVRFSCGPNELGCME